MESHECESPEIVRDPLVFGNPTSQQTWKSRYFFVGGQWEFPTGAAIPEKRVPSAFSEAPGTETVRYEALYVCVLPFLAALTVTSLVCFL